MQRLRDMFRKRPPTIDSVESTSQQSLRDSTDRCHGSEPSTPRADPLEEQPSPLEPKHHLSLPEKKQRSLSFGEIRPFEIIKAPRSQDKGSPSLEVPATGHKSTRSKSFDLAAVSLEEQRLHRRSQAFLEIPKWKMFVRRSSAGASSPPGDAFRNCVHCTLLEEFLKTSSSSPTKTAAKFGFVSSIEGSPSDGEESDGSEYMTRSASGSGDEEETRFSPSPAPRVTLSAAPDLVYDADQDPGTGVTVISLEVPVLPNSGRRASADLSYLKASEPKSEYILEVPGGTTKSIRSRSVDIGLPVGPDGPYLVVPNKPPPVFITQ